MILVGWTLRVAGIGVAVGAMVGVGVAPDGRAVAVGALPDVVVAVSVDCVLELDCDDEFEFDEEELLEDAEGARMMLKLRWKSTAKSAATSKTASKAASAVPAPDANARGPPARPFSLARVGKSEVGASQTRQWPAAIASGVKSAPQVPQYRCVILTTFG